MSLEYQKDRIRSIIYVQEQAYEIEYGCASDYMDFLYIIRRDGWSVFHSHPALVRL